MMSANEPYIFLGKVPMRVVQRLQDCSQRAVMTWFYLHLAMSVKPKTGYGVYITEADTDRWGMSYYQVYRGLKELEAKGLVWVDRRRGRSPLVSFCYKDITSGELISRMKGKAKQWKQKTLAKAPLGTDVTSKA